MRRSTFLLPVMVLALSLAGAAHAQTSSRTGSSAAGAPSGEPAHASGRPGARPPAGGVVDQSAASQDRELDEIGRKLLADTPRNPPNDDASTGGSLRPR